MPEKKWKYEHVEVVRVIDGDTVELRIDLGNRCLWQEKFRIYGIDTPETHGETLTAGTSAREALATMLARGILLAETLRPDKFGRTLARLTVMQNGFPVDVAQAMIAMGHGVEYYGGKK